MLTGDTYKLWFAPVCACALDSNSIILEVSNDFCEVWLKDNYLSLLQDVISIAAGRSLQVKFKVAAAGAVATISNKDTARRPSRPNRFLSASAATTN